MTAPIVDPSATSLPAGVVTFIFTDIEGSTRLAHELGEAWLGVLQEHHRVLRGEIAAHRGYEVSTAGDSFFIAFASPADAVAAAVAMQRAVAVYDWSPHQPIRVRMGIHTGEATLHDNNDYAGLTVHTAARVESAAAGGQVLITEAALVAAGSPLPAGAEVIDLGPHRLKDLPAEVRIYQVIAEGLDRDFPPIRSLDVIGNNVPVPPSSFIGRVDALNKLQRLMDSDRLVTLVGPGGAGKTRLSLKLAVERLHRYRDGVWFIELDPAHDEAGVAGALAEVLRVREDPGRTLTDSLVEYVRERDLLLVFDNCEHVIDAAAMLVDRLLRSGPKVHVLATSREPLSIGGERLWPVPPLSTDGDAPEESEAVRLLVDRVQLVQPDFELQPDDVGTALQICQRLDGLPLALELAAASAAMMDLTEIAERLDHRFELLTRGSRTALDRQKTLWGAIDWSYDLLDDSARRHFRELGAFPSEFDSETVAGVFSESEPMVAATIARLVAKSLVAPTPSGRFRLLESIRSYARERLDEELELAGVTEQHARWFADSVLSADPSPVWARELDLFEVVYDDLVAALNWTAEHDGPLGLRLLEPLNRFWARTGRWSEGRVIATRALAATAGLMIPERGRALQMTGELALNQGDYAAARTVFEENVAIQRAIGGEKSEVVALGNLGMVAIQQGDLETAEQLFTRSLASSRSTNSRMETAKTLAHLADIARHRGDLEQAWERGNEALEAAQEIGFDELADGVVNLLGSVAHQRGDFVTARRLYAEALEGARAINDTEPVIYLLFCLATLALDDGAPAEAAPLLAEALTLGLELDAQADLAESLEATARLAVSTGEADLACQLLAVVDTLRDAIGFPRPPAELAPHDALIATVQSACGEIAFSQRWSEGRAAALDDAVSAALAYLAED